MRSIFMGVIWAIQLVCLVTILWSAWVVLDRDLFALVASSIVLGVTLYLEHVFPPPEED
jgi:predicted neutral ceramidase superfamily lipid hydrolase